MIRWAPSGVLFKNILGGTFLMIQDSEQDQKSFLRNFEKLRSLCYELFRWF